MTENRQYKASIFADLFGDDEVDGKRNFLSLYNALTSSNLKYEETVMERKTIPQSMYHTFNNDVSMLINRKLVVLVEHQSTINENMPLRFLEYFTHILYGIVPSEVRYKRALYKIPTPEFFVLYTGKEMYPEEKILRLSDSFLEQPDSKIIPCELVVQVKNVQSEIELPLLKNCVILKQYCEFMEIIHNCRMAGMPDCFEKAINESIKRGILADFLSRKATEVRNMFLAEYDYDMDIAVQRQEAAEEAAREATTDLLLQLISKKLSKNLTPEQIADEIELPLEKTLQLISQL